MEAVMWSDQKYGKMADVNQTTAIVMMNKNDLNQYYTTELSTMSTFLKSS